MFPLLDRDLGIYESMLMGRLVLLRTSWKGAVFTNREWYWDLESTLCTEDRENYPMSR